MNKAKHYRNKVFWIIFWNVAHKHPDWSAKRVGSVTRYCLKKNEKYLKRC